MIHHPSSQICSCTQEEKLSRTLQWFWGKTVLFSILKTCLITTPTRFAAWNSLPCSGVPSPAATGPGVGEARGHFLNEQTYLNCAFVSIFNFFWQEVTYHVDVFRSFCSSLTWSSVSEHTTLYCLFRWRWWCFQSWFQHLVLQWYLYSK